MIFGSDMTADKFIGADEEPSERELKTGGELEAEWFNEVKSLLPKLENAPNSMMPDFIWEPVVNEFDDNDDRFNNVSDYVELGLAHGMTGHELSIAALVMPVKKRYSNYFEYIDALEIWNIYNNFVELNYGSAEELVTQQQLGMTTLRLVPKPKLKDKKKNRYLMKINSPISRRDKTYAMSEYLWKKTLDEWYSSEEEDVEFLDEETSERILQDMNDAQIKANERRNRLRNYRKTSNGYDTDEFSLFSQYVSNNSTSLSNGIKNKPYWQLVEEQDIDTDPESIESELDRLDFLNDALYEFSHNGDYIVKREDADANAFYSILRENGIDMSSTSSNKAERKYVKMLMRGAAGDSPEMSNKKRKKLMKQHKKTERKIYNKLMQDEKIRSVMTKNRIEFSPDDNMISFTLSDLWSESGGTCFNERD